MARCGTLSLSPITSEEFAAFNQHIRSVQNAKHMRISYERGKVLDIPVRPVRTSCRVIVVDPMNSQHTHAYTHTLLGWLSCGWLLEPKLLGPEGHIRLSHRRFSASSINGLWSFHSMNQRVYCFCLCVKKR